MQFFPPPPQCGASMEVCVYMGGMGIQREQILYFSGGGAVLLREVLRFSSFYSIDCWCWIMYRPQGAPPITAPCHRPSSDLCVCRYQKKDGSNFSFVDEEVDWNERQAVVSEWWRGRRWSWGFRRWGRTQSMWIKVGQREQPILSGEKMSRVPAANERTVNVGKTTRNQQSEINEVDQQNCFQNVWERVKRWMIKMLYQLFELVCLIAAWFNKCAVFCFFLRDKYALVYSQNMAD